MQLQTLANKISEINYRRKISAQHTTGKIHYVHEPDQKEIKEILKKRLKNYKNDFQNLAKSNSIKSPFLEIGAEYSLASSYLKSKFKADGVACDISLHSLTKAKHFARIFKLKKIPTLVCADADNLPFKSNSSPFIFVYESLHHFPNPKNPLKSLNRVLSPGGTLLIGSEPIKPGLKLNLWNRPNKLRPFEKILKALLVLPFVSNIGKTEIDHGIIETSFSIQTWINSLSIFDKYYLTIDVFPLGQVQKITKADSKLNLITKVLIFTLGGTIKAVCHKKNSKVPKAKSSEMVYICPECLNKVQKEIELISVSKDYHCPNCKTSYPNIEGMPIFLPPSLQRTLQKKLRSQ